MKTTYTQEEVQKIFDQQEVSSKMLVRRDLELTRANEMLRELDKRKSDFLSVMAHQLRTPLAGIKWTFNILLSEDLGTLNEEQKKFLMKGYESNQRMINLIEDMLGAERIGSGRAHFDFETTGIHQVLETVMFELTPQAANRDVSIKVEGINEKLTPVVADSEKLKAVFQNLIDNAIKYTRAGGTVTVRCTDNGEFFVIAIKDTGIGIPQEQQKYIFNRFYRAPNAIKEQTDGSGLGLFIVKGIVEKHGGTVWFDSEEGKGTTFYFTLRKEYNKSE
ncbi:MAG: HAMP domain-containing histidine kinase [Candidatus Taylorbacteria bacterium]|nr:HAMP domain-containing histidine kinase [Candidatus Taylorbacteria bacterium]